MEEGPECCRRGRRGPLGRRLERRVTALVPLLLTGVRHHSPGGPTRTSPMFRCAGGFPLIT